MKPKQDRRNSPGPSATHITDARAHVLPEEDYKFDSTTSLKVNVWKEAEAPNVRLKSLSESRVV